MARVLKMLMVNSRGDVACFSAGPMGATAGTTLNTCTCKLFRLGRVELGSFFRGADAIESGWQAAIRHAIRSILRWLSGHLSTRGPLIKSGAFSPGKPYSGFATQV